MPNIPENINSILQEFVVGVQEILGESLKKLFYMAPMLEEIMMRNLMLIL